MIGVDKEVTSRRAEIGRIPNGVEEDGMKQGGGAPGIIWRGW